MDEKPKIVAGLGDVRIWTTDCDCLAERQWLNDRLIAFGMEYIKRTLLPRRRRADADEDIFLMQPELSHLLLHAGPSPLQDLKLDTKRVILVPVNDADAGGGGSHWSVLACVRGGGSDTFSTFHLDSIYHGRQSKNARAASGLCENLASLINLEIVDDDSISVERQSNNFDCGIYAIAHCFHVCKAWVSTRAESKDPLDPISFMQRAVEGLSIQPSEWRKKLRQLLQENLIG